MPDALTEETFVHLHGVLCSNCVQLPLEGIVFATFAWSPLT